MFTIEFRLGFVTKKAKQSTQAPNKFKLTLLSSRSSAKTTNYSTIQFRKFFQVFPTIASLTCRWSHNVPNCSGCVQECNRHAGNAVSGSRHMNAVIFKFKSFAYVVQNISSRRKVYSLYYLRWRWWKKVEVICRDVASRILLRVSLLVNNPVYTCSVKINI